MSSWPGIVTHYREHLKIDHRAIPVTLLEGNTPLIPAPRLAAEIAPGFNLYLKFEGLNPTGSFKDRGMTAAITQAAFEGARITICASTGNTAAAAAAYSSRAGMRCFVLIPEGQVAAGKIAGAIAYGAEVIQIQGSFDDALRLVREISEKRPIALVNSINPYRIEGQKTAAFEICDALGDAPDWLCLPVGNAGNITAYWMGFKEYHGAGKSASLPQMLGVQAAGAAPLVLGHPVENPETVATAIRIGRPARGEQALEAAEESKGGIIAVADDEILAMWRRLAREGVFVEPASAAGLAGLAKDSAGGRLDLSGKTVVAVVTGHGLKDPDAVTTRAPEMKTIPANLDALDELIQR
ncbi:MAG TPA: threonine synthase [Anaerolineales bacterium]|nr:threonine synthase [Anaerolineales bacterium]